MNSGKKESHRESFIRRVSAYVPGPGFFVWLSLFVLVFSSPAPAQSQLPLIVQGVQTAPSHAPVPAASFAEQSAEELFTGSGSGIVAGQSGLATTGARMRNTRTDQSPYQQTLRSSVKFSFANQSPWRFQLIGTRAAIATPPFREILHSQKDYIDSGSVMARLWLLLIGWPYRRRSKWQNIEPRNKERGARSDLFPITMLPTSTMPFLLP